MTKISFKSALFASILAASAFSGSAYASGLFPNVDSGPYIGSMGNGSPDCGAAGQKACTFGELKFGSDNAGPYKPEGNLSAVNVDAGCGNKGEKACTLGTLRFGSDNAGAYAGE